MSLTAATTKMMNAISLGQYPSMNGSSAMTGVKQIRTSVMMFGRVHMATTYPSVLTTFLLIALSVSKTPSPVSATASK